MSFNFKKKRCEKKPDECLTVSELIRAKGTLKIAIVAAIEDYYNSTGRFPDIKIAYQGHELLSGKTEYRLIIEVDQTI